MVEKVIAARFPSPSPFRVRFGFFDVENHLADSLFIKQKLPVRFLQEWVSPKTEYRFIVCSVKKNDQEKFQNAMLEIENKMILCGHPNYIEDVQNLFREIKVFEGVNEE